ncbi:MAG TPA: hypothetical protein VNM91_04735 [Dehalococcoidia bacterium]|nr:hypothetical protein [Dehalococcoidia bacterium]
MARLLALVVVVGAIVALASVVRGATCGCGGQALPYTAIAAGAGALALLAAGAYLIIGTRTARR